MKKPPVIVLLLLFLYPLCLSFSQVAVIGELSQEREVSPGTSYEGTIVVRNDLDEPQEAKIYQTDYLFKYDGTNEYGEPGSARRSNAPWITFNPSYLTIPPRATAVVNYSVIVPQSWKGGVLQGSYWSMIMVEGIPKGSPESGLRRPGTRAQMGIQQTIRYGIQIVTHIENTGHPEVGFIGSQLLAREDGSRVLQVDIENSGDRAIRPDVYVELFNEQGAPHGKYSGVRSRIYPGTSIRQSIVLTNIPKGTYKALVVVDSGGDDVVAAQYTLKF